MKQLRLFHFDIRTYNNHGDTLLFEAARQLFNGFGGGRYFEVYDSRPLRDLVTPELVDYINDTVDAVVVGGGGLFLRDTNPNKQSGWQWNISVELLQRLKKPLIIFGVGNNRFIDQEDFSPLFSEHVNLTLEQSVFFGLRNSGSIETIKPYVSAANRDRITFQPCPTTLSSYLFPDLWRPDIDDTRRLAVQMIVGKRQVRVGFDADAIYRSVLTVLHRLEREGWTLESAPHAPRDLRFPRLAEADGLQMREERLFGHRDALYQGVEYFADLPMHLSTRGHGQMIPFGMGAVPVSLLVHHKTGYFARDIGHPELVVDPRQDDFEERLYSVLHDVADNRASLRDDLSKVRESFYDTTLANLASIYRGVTGVAVDEPSFTAYTPFERRLSDRAYSLGFDRAQADAKVRELETDASSERTDPVPGPRDRIDPLVQARSLRDRASAASRDGDYTTARALLRSIETIHPEHFTERPHPSWDRGPWRAVPAPLLQVAHSLRRR